MYITLLPFVLFAQYLVAPISAVPAFPPSLDALSLDLLSKNLTINNSSETTLTGPGFLPWTYSVPHSDVTIQYCFKGLPSCCGMPRCLGSVDPEDLEVLLIEGALGVMIKSLIEEYGADALSGLDDTGFQCTTETGLRLWIHRLPAPAMRDYTVGQIRDVIKGLIHLTLDQQKYCEVEFKFSGRDQLGFIKSLGQGSIKPGVPGQPPR